MENGLFHRITWMRTCLLTICPKKEIQKQLLTIKYDNWIRNSKNDSSIEMVPFFNLFSLVFLMIITIMCLLLHRFHFFFSGETDLWELHHFYCARMLVLPFYSWQQQKTQYHSAEKNGLIVGCRYNCTTHTYTRNGIEHEIEWEREGGEMMHENKNFCKLGCAHYKISAKAARV